MGYGDAHSDSPKPLKSQSGDVIGVTAVPSAVGSPTTGSFACEIRHPLSAIMANANAAQRWLNRPDPNLAEALDALARIVREAARIDKVI